jgi:CRISPR-associated protein Cmr3
MSTPSNWIGLRLDALDTLFFRDSRPFDAATRASGGLPQPQTLAGALRTALLARTGFQFAKFSKLRKDNPHLLREALLQAGASQAIVEGKFRGPWLGLAPNDNQVTPLIPMPETLKRGKDGGWSVAKPINTIPGWHDDNQLHPLWRDREADAKADPELLTFQGLVEFLRSGKHPAESDCVKREELFGFDHRVGIAVNWDTLTSADGQLYVISLLAMRAKFGSQNVCLYAEVSGELGSQFDEPLVVPFGGEGKYVQVTKVSAQEWPTTIGPNSVWYLATPTFFPPTGRPLPMPKNGTLISAASGSGIPISGWDVARNGPRATRFAVPAGAVYFVSGDASPEDFLNNGNENESTDLRQEGWGFALPGTWNGNLEDYSK